MNRTTLIDGPPATSVANPPFDVLVVDDDEFSRLVVSSVLRQSGHLVRCVSNGVEALSAFDEDPPDAVILDLQMPILDGFRTAAILRIIQSERAGKRIPIIAATARGNGLDETATRKAGMDGLIWKPIDADELQDLFDKLSIHGQTSPSQNPRFRQRTVISSESNVIDIEGALRRLGGDRGLLQDLVGFFFADAPGLMDKIRDAILRQDWQRCERAAHTIKGLAANFGAVTAVDALRSLERAATAGNGTEATSLLPTADKEVALLLAALSPYHRPVTEQIPNA